jgi:hypothetical protein
VPDDPTNEPAPDSSADPAAGLDARIAALRATVDALPQRRSELARIGSELAFARREQELAGSRTRAALAAARSVTLPRPRAWLNLLTGRYTAVRDAARTAAVDAGRVLEARDGAVQKLAADEARRATAVDAAAAALGPLADLEDARRLSRLVVAEDPRAPQIQALDSELALVTGQLREVDEASAAVAAALAAVDVTLDRLGSAHAWGTYDTFFGGGLLASAIKHDRIDEANDSAAWVARSLQQVRAELADVRTDVAAPQLHVDGLTRGLDVWFDNIFSDWSVQSRIKDQQSAVRHVGNALLDVRGTLATARTDLDGRRVAATARRRALLAGPGE